MSMSERIERRDIEEKLRELQGEVTEATDSAKSYVLIAGAVVGVVVIGVAFALGTRRGRRKSTVVEIRRI
jgi:hypothetical protein